MLKEYAGFRDKFSGKIHATNCASRRCLRSSAVATATSLSAAVQGGTAPGVVTSSSMLRECAYSKACCNQKMILMVRRDIPSPYGAMPTSVGFWAQHPDP